MKFLYKINIFFLFKKINIFKFSYYLLKINNLNVSLHGSIKWFYKI